MEMSLLTRRAAISLLAAFAASPTLARAAAAMRFRAIRVDVGPLRATGDVTSAAVIARELPGLLQQAFGAYLTPGDARAPVIVARVDSVSYGTPGSSPGPFLISTTDYIEGAALVMSGGRVVATYPLTTSNSVTPDLVAPTDNSSSLRTAELAGVFARFLPGQMGLG